MKVIGQRSWSHDMKIGYILRHNSLKIVTWMLISQQPVDIIFNKGPDAHFGIYAPLGKKEGSFSGSECR